MTVELTRNELHALTQLLADRRVVPTYVRESGLSPLGKKILRTTLRDLAKYLLTVLHEK